MVNIKSGAFVILFVQIDSIKVLHHLFVYVIKMYNNRPAEFFFFMLKRGTFWVLRAEKWAAGESQEQS